MRIAAFIPAVLALTLFSATQAAPAQHDTTAISMLKKRGIDGVDAIVHLYTKVVADVALKTCDKIEVDLCADVVVDLKVDANVLGGLVTAKVNVDQLKLQTKDKVDVDVKAEAKTHVKVEAVAPIKAIVHESIIAICPLVNNDCLNKKANAIVADINAKINVHVSKVFVDLKSHIDAHVRLRIKAIVEEVCVHLGIADVTIHARAWVASNIDAHVKVWVKLWVKLWAKVNLVAKIRAL
ncbi:hypothetical protein K457DRAFT_889852 [Linnemannia elongata AG-77]|uniref:Lipid-binding serum glycoprotein N-terminal domain-containing protein n=1 Tax=Linnemannia elongata AG-77 TaxID=1314771 RepID=A0A197K6D9_9FUNG|nr:hypothetical protein K457DRAFT_889852 [Linnemannia elongata AG-77]